MKTTKLANLNQVFERLHLNELVTHIGGLAPLLNGFGAGLPADGALSATKSGQVTQEKFFQLSQTVHIVLELLIQAGAVGIGFGAVGVVGVGVGAGVLLARKAQTDEFLQISPAAALLNAAQVDESFELKVAILSLVEMLLGFIEHASKLLEIGALRIADIADIARQRRHRFFVFMQDHIGSLSRDTFTTDAGRVSRSWGIASRAAPTHRPP